jgi:predicted secreted Zn-dependent protease
MHYNISALGGRDLERGLLALSASSTTELITKKEELSAKIQALIDKTNEEYDNRIMWGTDHGRIKLHQDLWEMHLAKLMNDPNGELKSVYYVMQR